MNKIPWFNEKTNEGKCRNLILAMALFDDDNCNNDPEVTLEAADYLKNNGKKHQEHLFTELTDYLPLAYGGEKIFHLQKYEDILMNAELFVGKHS